MNKLAPFFLLPFLFLVGACSTLGDIFGEGTVVTTSDQVLEGGEYAVIPTEDLPEEVLSALPEGQEVVVTDREDLVEGATYVPADGVVTDQGMEGLIRTAFGVGSAFLPGLAAWEGVALFLSKRKRKHYAKAVKAAVPTDRNIDLGEAVRSIGAALGFNHSSTDSEAAFEHEAAPEMITEERPVSKQ